jgi:RNA recognition motif-containing protein
MAKLFIVGFPRDMDEVELVELFSNHGIVDNVTVVTDQITGENKGYGFISMADRIGADRAIEALDQAEIDGRVISCSVKQMAGIWNVLLSLRSHFATLKVHFLPFVSSNIKSSGNLSKISFTCSFKLFGFYFHTVLPNLYQALLSAL